MSDVTGGDRRGRERRKADRRRDERRGPVPLWRRPAAYVSYGVVGALILFMLIQGGDGDEAPTEAVVAAAEPDPAARAAERAVVPSVTRDAYTLGQFAELIAEGNAAVGEIVRTELACGSIMAVATRDVTDPNPTLTTLVDQDGRVAGAECRWSREDRSGDFLLIVPPELAVEFARAPEVELNFVRLRVIRADVEWLGRSEELSLRTAGILRAIR